LDVILERESSSHGGATVSALVAAYNPAYLEAALRSVLGQSYQDLEVVVVDDGPADSVQRIVDSLGDPRIRYFRNHENLGTALSYRRAIELATGQFLAVINDDDVWEPEFAETLLGALREHPEAVVAFSDHWVLTGGARDVEESDRLSARWGRAGLANGPHQPFRRLAVVDGAVPMAIAALFRRDAVIESPIPAAVGGAYDLYLAYALSRNGAGAVYVDRRLSSWRVHPTNQTNVRSCARAEQNAAAVRLIFEDAAFADLRSELEREYGTRLRTVATRNLRYGSDRRALHAILAALRHRNGRAGLLLGLLLVPAPLRRRLWSDARVTGYSPHPSNAAGSVSP
jgi:glycosyltransferase involved in cell wall biosynthesis